MIVREKLVKLKKDRDCLVCRNTMPDGSLMTLSVSYNPKTKHIAYLYVCQNCMNKLTNNELFIPRIEEAYCESCE